MSGVRYGCRIPVDIAKEIQNLKSIRFVHQRGEIVRAWFCLFRTRNSPEDGDEFFPKSAMAAVIFKQPLQSGGGPLRSGERHGQGMFSQAKRLRRGLIK